MTPVSPRSLCVTKGKVETASGRGLKVDVGGMRAVVGAEPSRVAELAFTYRGPSVTTSPLASGEVRRQIGLKLRAKDSCNLVYVMWRTEPTSGVYVQVKSNPGKSTHAACGAGGYTTIKAVESKPTRAALAGEAHVLRAEMEGKALRVSADGEVVWEGLLPNEALAFDGPAGVRSDNGSYEFELRVPGGGRLDPVCPAGSHGSD